MSTGSPAKVLLVDDSDLGAAMVGQSLEEAGFLVIRGRNGVEGVELAYQEIPDVIIMDAEMPLMHGYLASRLLKSRRGVRDIPIIMHTSLSEDRDRYWALASGTDEFVTKDFDAIERLLDRVRVLAAHPPLAIEAVREDAALMSREKIFEMLGSVLDQQLFQSTITGLLNRVSRNMASLPDTARNILELVSKVCETHVGVLLLEYDRVPLAFILASPELGLEGIKEFLKVCLGDFHNHFPTLDLTATRETRFAGAPVAAGDGAAGGQRLSSYTSIALTGRNDQTIGSMHLGHRANNYFTEKLNDNINLFALNAGIILDNSILFNQTAQMHTRVRQAFAKFVPEEIIADLIAERQGDERLVGEKRVVTVLFADIRGFTAISENNSAESTVAFLNNYFKIMVAIINRHGGTIDKFIGDAILAVFGAPTSYEDNTPRAVRAAREMIGALPQVAVDRLAIPDGRLYIGVGIHEGEVIVGNIGSADKFDYTVIGDTVNLASRLEGLTKYYQQPIIVSESVRKRLDRDIPCLELDTVRVMGKENATNIYAILPDESDHDAEFMGHFSKALKMYRMGNWSTAAEYFDRALQRQPRDRSTAIFLERCAAYQADPPPQWDGSMVLDFK